MLKDSSSRDSNDRKVRVVELSSFDHSELSSRFMTREEASQLVNGDSIYQIEADEGEVELAL